MGEKEAEEDEEEDEQEEEARQPADGQANRQVATDCAFTASFRLADPRLRDCDLYKIIKMMRS